MIREHSHLLWDLKLPAISMAVAMCTILSGPGDNATRAFSDDLFGNRTLAPERLAGKWILTSTSEYSERYGLKVNNVIEPTCALHFTESHIRTVSKGAVISAREYFIASPGNVELPTQHLYYCVSDKERLFGRVPVTHERLSLVDTPRNVRLVEYDILRIQPGPIDELIPPGCLTPNRDVAISCQFTKERGEASEPTLPSTPLIERYPEEIHGVWLDGSLKLTVSEQEIQFSREDSKIRLVRRQKQEYIPGGAQGAMFLPLDGSQGYFLKLPVNLTPSKNTLTIGLERRAVRWLSEVLPADIQETAELKFHRVR